MNTDTPRKTMNANVLRIAHIADVHLRDSQYGSAQRGDDFAASAMLAIHTAIEQRVDAVVIAGDLFNNARPSPKQIAAALLMSNMLQQAGIPGLHVTGNHDMNKPVTWAKALFHTNQNAGLIDLDGRSITLNGYTFRGIPFMTPAEFAKLEFTSDTDVIIYHGYVNGVVDSFNDPNALDIKQFPTTDARLKAVLLGDIHVRKYKKVDKTLVGYPGSTDLCSTSESVDKFVTIIELTDSYASVIEELPLKSRDKVVAAVRTSDELDEVVERVKNAKDPLVLVDFDRELIAQSRKLYNVANPQAIIRCRPLPKNPESMHKPREQQTGERKTFLDFVRQRLDGRADMAELAEKILAANAIGAMAVLNEYVNTRKGNKQLL